MAFVTILQNTVHKILRLKQHSRYHLFPKEKKIITTNGTLVYTPSLVYDASLFPVEIFRNFSSGFPNSGMCLYERVKEV